VRREEAVVLWIVRVALSRPYTFIVMALVIAIFGTLSALAMAIDIFPSIGIPVVAVVWTYTGMLPSDMSGRIVYFYERTLTQQVSNIERMESQSLSGYGIVRIYFTTNVDLSQALAQVTAASQTVLKLLPPGITPPYVLSFHASSVPVLQVALSSKDQTKGKRLPQMQLYDLGENFIRPQLASVDGAAVPSPFGGKVKQIQVDLDQHEMQSHNVSAEDVVNAVTNQNLIIPAGTEKMGKFEWNVALNASPDKVQQINRLPVKEVNGTIVYIRDVAYVHEGYPPQTNIIRVNGQHAALLEVLKIGGASTLSIVSQIKSLLNRVQGSMPSNLRMDIVSDQSTFVRAAVTGVAREAVIAALLVGIMILLFLGSWRSTVIIVLEIPLAILFAVIALWIRGQTLNTMTLGGLALAVGILVDDGTVTIENINYHLEQGKRIGDAIMDGARQIVVPAFVTLLCISIVFVPMFRLSGVSGYLFRPMAEAVVFALIGSFTLSRTLVPTLANYLLAAQEGRDEHRSEHGELDQNDTSRQGARPPRGSVFRSLLRPLHLFQQGFQTRFERVRNRYQALLSLTLDYPKTFIAGFLACVVLSLGLTPFLGETFFPSVESNQVMIHVRAQTGTRVEETARLCDLIERYIRQQIAPDQIENFVDNIDLPVSGINMAYSNTGTIGPEDADILLTLKGDYPSTHDLTKKLRSELPHQFPGAIFYFPPADITTQVLNFGTPAPIDVKVIGQEREGGHAYAVEILKRLRAVPGIVDARVQQRVDYPQINVDADRSLAGLVGPTQRNVADSLLTTLGGSIQVHPNFWLDTKSGVSYPLVVQMPQYRIDTVSDLLNVPITSGAGKPLQYLGGLGSLNEGPSPAVESHYDVEPLFDVYAAVQDRDLGGIAKDVNRILSDTKKDVPHGSRVSLTGQVQTMRTAFDQLYLGLAGAIVLIYLVIVVNFQSWVDPFIIITALPGALAGIVWMLFLTGTYLSVPALTGAIMCMGIATANSILVVSFAREGLASGLDARQAALESGGTRFRPVLMTALAMIIGMLPMAMALGEGGEQNAPLGRAVIGGLAIATIATLFFVPTVFALVHRQRAAQIRSDAGGREARR
jgi:multidrug efflux pump subunit AcrB